MKRGLEAATRRSSVNFAKFTEKHLCSVSFLIQLKASGLQLY